MTGTSLTPEEFELHVQDLRQKLRGLLERGEGSLDELRKEAEQVWSLADQFPEVWGRYPELPGLVGELLARDKQREYMAFGAQGESTGCLLGWLTGGRGRGRARRR